MPHTMAWHLPGCVLIWGYIHEIGILEDQELYFTIASVDCLQLLTHMGQK